VRVDSVADRAMDQLFDLAVVLGDLMSARLVQHGLTPARAEVLWVLHRRGPLTQRELSQILNCTPRNVTGLVDALLHAGLVDRVPHPSDRRAVQVSVSKQGRAVLEGWSAERVHGIAGVLGDIAPAELAIFTDVLDRVLRNLRRTYLSA
jgi:DNA-binding MarR family transcriptional regulator